MNVTTIIICDRICENQAYGIIINLEIRVKIDSCGLLRRSLFYHIKSFINILPIHSFSQIRSHIIIFAIYRYIMIFCPYRISIIIKIVISPGAALLMYCLCICNLCIHVESGRDILCYFLLQSTNC